MIPPDDRTVPVDITRLAAVMRQGDKSTKYLNRDTGAILDSGDLDRLLRGLSGEERAGVLRVMLEIPKTDSRTVFRWMQDWIKQETPRLSDPDYTDHLLDILNGDGAFRRFKDALNASGRQMWNTSWDGYRQRMLCERARIWLSQSGVHYRELDTAI